MRVAPHYILVSINKKERKERQEKLDSGIFLSPKFTFMTRNLQYGEVLQIGSVAAKHFPEAKVGDIAIFHHLVEDESKDHECLVEDRLDSDYEIRALKGTVNFEIFGFLSADGYVLKATHDNIFLDATYRPLYDKVTSTTLILPENAGVLNEEKLAKDLEYYTHICEKYKDTLSRQTDEHAAREIVDQLDYMYSLRRQITFALNKAKMQIAKVLSISDPCSKQTTLHPGDELIVESREYLYPLEIKGKHFLKLDSMFAVAKL